jgi:hypothetical protein
MPEATREKQVRAALAEAIEYLKAMGEQHVPREVIQRWHALLDLTEEANYHYNAVYLGAPLTDRDTMLTYEEIVREEQTARDEGIAPDSSTVFDLTAPVVVGMLKDDSYPDQYRLDIVYRNHTGGPRGQGRLQVRLTEQEFATLANPTSAVWVDAHIRYFASLPTRR